MKLGIVILNYNDFDTTAKLLELIKDYEPIDQIIVVDNKSIDNSYERLVFYESENIHIIKSDINNGYSSGNNIGIRWMLENTDVEIIGVSNPDVKFEKQLIYRIKELFQQYENYAIFAGLQMNKEGEVADHPFWPEYSNKQWFVRKIESLHLFYHFLKVNSNRTYIKKKLLEKNNLVSVGAVEGSLFFIRRSDIETIGLFDEKLKFYCEEDILAKKIKKIGKKIGVDKSVNYIHFGSVTTKKNFNSYSKSKYMFASSIYYFNKYQSNNMLLKILNYLLCRLIEFEDFVTIMIKKVIYK